MGVIEILAALFRGKPGRDGMWDFLGKRAEAKYRVGLEQERNDGTQKLIPLLQPGMVVIERGHDWTREIRMPEAPLPGTLLNTVISQPAIPPLPADELAPAPRKELGSSADPC